MGPNKSLCWLAFAGADQIGHFPLHLAPHRTPRMRNLMSLHHATINIPMHPSITPGEASDSAESSDTEETASPPTSDISTNPTSDTDESYPTIDDSINLELLELAEMAKQREQLAAGFIEALSRLLPPQSTVSLTFSHFYDLKTSTKSLDYAQALLHRPKSPFFVTTPPLPTSSCTYSSEILGDIERDYFYIQEGPFDGETTPRQVRKHNIRWEKTVTETIHKALVLHPPPAETDKGRPRRRAAKRVPRKDSPVRPTRGGKKNMAPPHFKRKKLSAIVPYTYTAAFNSVYGDIKRQEEDIDELWTLHDFQKMELQSPSTRECPTQSSLLESSTCQVIGLERMLVDESVSVAENPNANFSGLDLDRVAFPELFLDSNTEDSFNILEYESMNIQENDSRGDKEIYSTPTSEKDLEWGSRRMHFGGLYDCQDAVSQAPLANIDCPMHQEYLPPYVYTTTSHCEEEHANFECQLDCALQNFAFEDFSDNNLDPLHSSLFETDPPYTEHLTTTPENPHFRLECATPDSMTPMPITDIVFF